MRHLALIALLISVNTFADTISMRADKWCPYNCEPGSKDPGYLIEIAEKAFAKAGHKVDYQILAWNKTLVEVAEGKFDVAVAGSKNSFDNEVITEPVGASVSCFYAKKDSKFKFTDLNNLKGKKIGIIQGYDYSKELNDDIKKNAAGYDAAFGENPLLLNMRKLDAGRVDLVLETDSVFAFTSKMEKMGEKFINTGCLPTKDSLYLNFSGKNPKSVEYVKAFNEGLADLRKSGELKIILDKYEVKDWK